MRTAADKSAQRSCAFGWRAPQSAQLKGARAPPQQDGEVAQAGCSASRGLSGTRIKHGEHSNVSCAMICSVLPMPPRRYTEQYCPTLDRWGAMRNSEYFPTSAAGTIPHALHREQAQGTAARQHGSAGGRRQWRASHVRGPMRTRQRAATQPTMLTDITAWFAPRICGPSWRYGCHDMPLLWQAATTGTQLWPVCRW